MPFWTSALLVIALSKLMDTGMPTPTVVPSSGVKLPMKLLAGETVVNEAFSCAARPLESSADHAVGVDPVTGVLLAAVGGDGDALLDIGLVGDRLVEVDGHRHADTHRGAVVRGEVADEAVGRRDGGERGVLVRRAALGVLG